jgi:hypothetical protein
MYTSSNFMKIAVICTVYPYSLVDRGKRFGVTSCPHLQGYSFTLILEAASFSEMLVTIYQTTRLHVADTSNLYRQRSETSNLVKQLYSPVTKQSGVVARLMILFGSYLVQILLKLKFPFQVECDVT